MKKVFDWFSFLVICIVFVSSCLMLIALLSSCQFFPLSGLEINEEAFPDSAFRWYVSANADLDGDGRLSDQERLDVKTMDLAAETRIDSLQGLAYFPALQELDCAGLYLSQLDLSSLSRLAWLDVSENNLTQLDLSASPLLEFLDCSDNDLASLTLAESPALQQLDCRGNSLTALDLTGCSALRQLDCSLNHLTALTLPENGLWPSWIVPGTAWHSCWYPGCPIL